MSKHGDSMRLRSICRLVINVSAGLFSSDSCNRRKQCSVQFCDALCNCSRVGDSVWYAADTLLKRSCERKPLTILEHLEVDDSDVLFHIEQWQRAARSDSERSQPASPVAGSLKPSISTCQLPSKHVSLRKRGSALTVKASTRRIISLKIGQVMFLTTTITRRREQNQKTDLR